MIIRLYFIFSLFFTSGIFAQHHHYLYIQSEPPQAFYLKLGPDVLNSNAGGFLILPKLRDSSYSFTIGFPGNLFPPYKFTIASMKKDKGFSLKNFGDKGWGLFDLQTLEILMGEKVGGDQAKKEYYQPALTQDAFTTILAAVIDDPGLTSTQLVGKEDLMVAAVVPAVKKSTDSNLPEAISPSLKKNKTPVEGEIKTSAENAGTVAGVGEPPKIKDEKKIVAPEKSPEKKSVASVRKDSKKPITKTVETVKKISQENVADGLLIVYSVPVIPGKPDTVNVLIPAYKEDVAIAQRESVPEKKNAAPDVDKKTTSVTEVLPEKATQEIKSDDKIDVAPVIASSAPVTRQDCRKVATDKDLTALKRKILTIREESDMVSAALKEFKQKCYNTDQVKNISFIFLTDEGKYKLMDAAYPYVYDPASFSGLESLLNDTYYINRFKALLR